MAFNILIVVVLKPVINLVGFVYRKTNVTTVAWDSVVQLLVLRLAAKRSSSTNIQRNIFVKETSNLSLLFLVPINTRDPLFWEVNHKAFSKEQNLKDINKCR